MDNGMSQEQQVTHDLLAVLFKAMRDTLWMKSEQDRLRVIQERWNQALWDMGEITDEPS